MLLLISVTLKLVVKLITPDIKYGSANKSLLKHAILNIILHLIRGKIEGMEG